MLPHWTLNSTETISMSIKTTVRNGLILYSGKANQHEVILISFFLVMMMMTMIIDDDNDDDDDDDIVLLSIIKTSVHSWKFLQIKNINQF